MTVKKILVSLAVVLLYVGCSHSLADTTAKINPLTPLPELQKLADSDNVDAQLELAYRYAGLYGGNKDEKKAAEWFVEGAKHARKGSVAGMICRGNCYQNGFWLARSLESAVEWYRKAAETGDARGQLELGVCIRNGKGIEKNEKEGIQWICKAAEQGLALAQMELGVCIRNGEGIEKNEKEGIQWICKAAEQGHALAQNATGDCYRTGTVVEQNLEKAVYWYQKAFDQGVKQAKENLDRCVRMGFVPPPTASDMATLAEKEVDFDLYCKAAGFSGSEANFKTLLQEVTAQLRAKRDELEKKFRAADEFDKPALQKQLDAFNVQAKAQRAEIEKKTFCREYENCSPYDIKVGDNFSSFVLDVGRGFTPFDSTFGQFASPFPNLTAEIKRNKRDGISSIIDAQTGAIPVGWDSITITGDTESIKTLVRGMKDNPKRYALKLWFTDLTGVSNMRRGLDFNNPFGERRWTEFLVGAKIQKVQIVDKTDETTKYYTVGKDAVIGSKNTELEGQWQLFYTNGKKGGVHTVRYDKVKEQYEMSYSKGGQRVFNIRYDGRIWSFDESADKNWKNAFEKVDGNTFVGTCTNTSNGEQFPNQKLVRIR